MEPHVFMQQILQMSKLRHGSSYSDRVQTSCIHILRLAHVSGTSEDGASKVTYSRNIVVSVLDSTSQLSIRGYAAHHSGLHPVQMMKVRRWTAVLVKGLTR